MTQVGLRQVDGMALEARVRKRWWPLENLTNQHFGRSGRSHEHGELSVATLHTIVLSV
jgi:hypothetical protein